MLAPFKVGIKIRALLPIRPLDVAVKLTVPPPVLRVRLVNVKSPELTPAAVVGMTALIVEVPWVNVTAPTVSVEATP